MLVALSLFLSWPSRIRNRNGPICKWKRSLAKPAACTDSHSFPSTDLIAVLPRIPTPNAYARGSFEMGRERASYTETEAPFASSLFARSSPLGPPPTIATFKSTKLLHEFDVVVSGRLSLLLVERRRWCEWR